jgi:hypothetical protein
MTNPLVLAGSVFAAVALWVGVYTALLPKHVPASPDVWQTSTSERVSVLDLEQEEAPPRRWVDLPREVSVSASDLPVRDDKPSTTIMPAVGHALNSSRLGHPPQIRKTALPDQFTKRRLIRERAFTPRRVHARTRYRPRPEPIQFSLATRSSS